MTPKEKAKELVDKFYQTTPNKSWFYPPNKSDIFNDSYNTWSQAKECALIAIEEILKITLFYNDTHSETNYWNDVKCEIQNL